MNSRNNNTIINEEDIIRSSKRGDILYYSITQVANLLDQEDSTIRYYTNVFDNILKIDISNKEFQYTDKDIDKLEFLINLRNKGMTIKEIQKYCEELPLSLEDLTEVKDNKSISAKEIITTIIGLENKEINNLKDDLSNKIKEDNQSYIENITNLMLEQEKQLKLFKQDLISELKQYIDYKFDMEYKSIKDLYDDISIKMDNIISDKGSLLNDIKLQFDEFSETAASRDTRLIDEIKRFKNVIEHAYYIQQEIDTSKQKLSFIERLFGAR